MYTDYPPVDSTFRICRYNRSSPHTFISCCDCYKNCDWGQLNCNDDENNRHTCQVNTSRLGLYQFMIITNNYPCYFNIGDPIDVNDINNPSSSHSDHQTILYILIYSLAGLLALILSVSTGYCVRRHYMRRPHATNVGKLRMYVLNVYSIDVPK